MIKNPNLFQRIFCCRTRKQLKNNAGEPCLAASFKENNQLQNGLEEELKPTDEFCTPEKEINKLTSEGELSNDSTRPERKIMDSICIEVERPAEGDLNPEEFSKSFRETLNNIMQENRLELNVENRPCMDDEEESEDEESQEYELNSDGKRRLRTELPIYMSPATNEEETLRYVKYRENKDISFDGRYEALVKEMRRIKHFYEESVPLAEEQRTFEVGCAREESQESMLPNIEFVSRSDKI